MTTRTKKLRTIADLVFDDKNANRGTDRGRELVGNSLERYGGGRSVLADKRGKLIAGNKTVEQAARLGKKIIVVPTRGDELVVVQRTDLDMDQDPAARELAIADNRSSEVGLDWDEAMLDELRADGVDLAAFFTDAELDEIIGQGEPAPLVDADAQVERADELRRKWSTAPGQLWTIGPHRLLCGDATSPADLARLCGGECGAVVTDPPYGINLDTDWSDATGSLKSIGHRHRTRGKKYDRVIGDAQPFDPKPILEFARGVKEVFLFGADYYAERIADRGTGSMLVWDKRKPSQSEAIGSEFELIWSKAKHKRRILRHDWFGFLSSGNTSDARHRVHPMQKPVTLIAEIITLWKLPSPIVDLYAGSGSTIVAAQNLDRVCYALEISPAYVAVILERMTAAFPKIQVTLAQLAPRGRRKAAA